MGTAIGIGIAVVTFVLVQIVKNRKERKRLAKAWEEQQRLQQLMQGAPEAPPAMDEPLPPPPPIVPPPPPPAAPPHGFSYATGTMPAKPISTLPDDLDSDELE